MQLDVKITGKTTVEFIVALEHIVEKLGRGDLVGKGTIIRGTTYSFGFRPLPRASSARKRKISGQALG